MAIRHNVIKNSSEDNNILHSRKQSDCRTTKDSYLCRRGHKTAERRLSKAASIRSQLKVEKFQIADTKSRHRRFMSNFSLLRCARQENRNIAWWAFVATVIASLFGQLSTVTLATTNNLPSQGVGEIENQDKDVTEHHYVPLYAQGEENYPDYLSDGSISGTDSDDGETICFYSESDDNADISCLPEIDSENDVEKRANYLFRSKKASYLFRSRRAPSYLFRSKKAPSYLFRSRRSAMGMNRDRKAQGYLFRSRRAPAYLFRTRKAPSYLFRSKKAPSYLFRSKKAPSYLFRSKKSDARQARSYYFRSRKAPGYLFRSRRGKSYLFRSRRAEPTEDDATNINDLSRATRAGYLFRTRKSVPGSSRDPENAKMSDDDNLMSRPLRSRSYLFRSKKSLLNPPNPLGSSDINVATRGSYLFRT